MNIAIDATGMQTGTANKDAEYGVLGVLSTAKTVFESGSQTNVSLLGNAVDAAGQNGTVGLSGKITAAGDVSVVIASEGGIGIRTVATVAGDAAE